MRTIPVRQRGCLARTFGSLLIPFFTGDVVLEVRPVVRASVGGTFWMDLVLKFLIVDLTGVPLRDILLFPLLA